MAITLNLNWRGVHVPNAYIRVDSVTGGKRENRVTPQMPGEAIWNATVGVYADAEQPTPIYVANVIIPWDGESSPYPAIYAALKSAPEFYGASDC